MARVRPSLYSNHTNPPNYQNMVPLIARLHRLYWVTNTLEQLNQLVIDVFGLSRQIPLLYSFMVLSVEKRPLAAVL